MSSSSTALPGESKRSTSPTPVLQTSATTTTPKRPEKKGSESAHDGAMTLAKPDKESKRNINKIARDGGVDTGGLDEESGSDVTDEALDDLNEKADENTVLGAKLKEMHSKIAPLPEGEEKRALMDIFDQLTREYAAAEAALEARYSKLEAKRIEASNRKAATSSAVPTRTESTITTTTAAPLTGEVVKRHRKHHHHLPTHDLRSGAHSDAGNSATGASLIMGLPTSAPALGETKKVSMTISDSDDDGDVPALNVFDTDFANVPTAAPTHPDYFGSIFRQEGSDSQVLQPTVDAQRELTPTLPASPSDSHSGRDDGFPYFDYSEDDKSFAIATTNLTATTTTTTTTTAPTKRQDSPWPPVGGYNFRAAPRAMAAPGSDLTTSGELYLATTGNDDSPSPSRKVGDKEHEEDSSESADFFTAPATASKASVRSDNLVELRNRQARLIRNDKEKRNSIIKKCLAALTVCGVLMAIAGALIITGILAPPLSPLVVGILAWSFIGVGGALSLGSVGGLFVMEAKEIREADIAPITSAPTLASGQALDQVDGITMVSSSSNKIVNGALQAQPGQRRSLPPVLPPLAEEESESSSSTLVDEVKSADFAGLAVASDTPVVPNNLRSLQEQVDNRSLSQKAIDAAQGALVSLSVMGSRARSKLPGASTKAAPAADAPFVQSKLTV